MPRAIQIAATGGPEQLQLADVPVGDPGPGQVLIRHEACGLNYIDVYHRTGLYPLALPHGIGMEGAGVIEAVGPGVTHLEVGDRAAYASNPPGSYCEQRVMPAKTVCRLPDAIDFETARRDDAQGPDGAVPAQAHAAAGRARAGRLHPVARGRGRRRADRVPVGQGDGAAADRHRRQRGEVRAGAGAWRRACDRLPHRQTSSPASRTSPAATASRSSTTRSARTPSTAPSIACARSA